MHLIRRPTDQISKLLHHIDLVIPQFGQMRFTSQQQPTHNRQVRECKNELQSPSYHSNSPPFERGDGATRRSGSQVMRSILCSKSVPIYVRCVRATSIRWLRVLEHHPAALRHPSFKKEGSLCASIQCRGPIHSQILTAGATRRRPPALIHSH